MGEFGGGGNVDRNGNVDLRINTTLKKYNPPYNNLSVRLPAGYRSMSFREKQIEGKMLDLVNEDRLYTVATFELPLGTTTTPTEASFEFRSHRHG